uniref:Transcription factor bHLH18-like n=1 Tax=Elaeis guineensis var. tenera TaxID=51953 RepID=A0A6J0PRQ6_ELAGV|nr:transcription factor bHLH18-like [Elaeis guineensis]XP_029124409.1 transcription factor bHLH18-like [Elaeis guineensis]
MEQSPVQWPSEADEYSTFIFPSEMTSLDHFDAQEIIRSLGEDFEYPSCFSSFDSPGNTELNAPMNCSSMEVSEGPIDVNKADGVPGAVPNASSISLISFGHPEPVHDPLGLWPRNESFYCSHGSTSNEKTLDFRRPERNRMMSRSTSQDHVMAERKRREKLGQQFIALSAIIPDLKKTDKASLVGGAINYLKQLEEKVKTLEEQAVKKNTRPIVFVKKSHLSTNNAISNADGSSPDKAIQKVEASLEGKTILMRIHCEKKKGILVKVLSEIEKLHLSVINTGVVPFTDSSLNITVTAQIEEGFSMTVQDLVKELNSALSQLL